MSHPGESELVERLKFYRTECFHEFNLLNSRMGWFLVVQSFLIAAFSQAIGYKLTGSNWFAQMALPAIGIVASVVAIPGIKGAYDAVDYWVNVQRQLIQDNYAQLKAYSFGGRDDKTATQDQVHRRSHFFAKWLPWLSIFMWLVLCVLAFVAPLRIAA